MGKKTEKKLTVRNRGGKNYQKFYLLFTSTYKLLLRYFMKLSFLLSWQMIGGIFIYIRFELHTA